MSKLLTEKEVAEQIQMSVHWLRRMRWQGGGIPFHKMADKGAVRYRQESVDTFITERMRNSTCDKGTSSTRDKRKTED